MTNNRVTQARAMAGTAGSGVERVTQARVMVGIQLFPPQRVTQALVMSGIQTNPNVRVTQARVMLGVRLETPPCLTRDADCWRIERTDGTVYRYTSHDRAVRFQGETYQPCNSLSSSALQLTAEFGDADNVDLSGIITLSGVSESDLWAHRFDGATVEIYRVGWDGSGGRLVASGNCGALQFTDNGYKFEVVTAGERLQQRPILHAVTATCRFKLGDSRCTVNTAALAQTGAVTTALSVNVFTQQHRRGFVDSSRGEAAGYWALGRLTWTSGSNVGQSVDVKSFSSGSFVLERPAQYPIEVGDAYSITPGCDLLIPTCDAKFSNSVNFGGFPHLRGADDLSRTPKVRLPGQ